MWLERRMRLKFDSIALVFIASLAALAPNFALAWGEEGHEIIGLIAEHYLKPNVREQVTALSASCRASARISADRIRGSGADV
jgi:hypothetical protein